MFLYVFCFKCFHGIMVRIFDFEFSNLNLSLNGTFLTSILPLLIIIQLSSWCNNYIVQWSSWCNNYIVQSFHGLHWTLNPVTRVEVLVEPSPLGRCNRSPPFQGGLMCLGYCGLILTIPSMDTGNFRI